MILALVFALLASRAQGDMYVNDLPTPTPIIAIQASNSPVIDSRTDRNIALGQELALQEGISDHQWTCLYYLGMKESGWDDTAENKTSKALGIAQALPASKMLPYGNIYSPRTQILFMLDYISNRYGSPCNAYQFELENNWY